MTKVLVVATSRKTRGGITAVLKAYENGYQWQHFHCHWVQTHRDGFFLRKLLYFITGMMNFLCRLPFYDIVHIHTADFGTEKRKRIFAYLTKLFRKKLIVHLHSSGTEYSIGGKYSDLYKFSFSHADKVIFLSKTWRDETLRIFKIPDNKIEIIYNPCPEVIPSSMEERKKYILYAGTLTHRKGYDDLIKAFAQIAPYFPEWKLKFAGNGEIENGKRLATQYGIKDQVEFLGWINNLDKDKAFRHASIYCLPSYSEGFPMGVLDAWAYNLPVITTPVGGIPDVGINRENIMLFEPGDIKALSSALSFVMSSKHMQDKLTLAAKDFANGKFNLKNITNQISHVYDSLT